MRSCDHPFAAACVIVICMIPYAPTESVTVVVVDAIRIRAGSVANFLYDIGCCSANPILRGHITGPVSVGITFMRNPPK